MKHLLMVCLATSSMIAFASNGSAPATSDTVLALPVNYAAGASAPERIKEKCKLDEYLSNNISHALASQNKSGVGTLEQGAKAGDAAVLHVEITNAFGAGGGAWSGPKVMSVSAQLMDANGKLIRQTHLTRTSTGGVFGAFKGTCSIIDRDAKKLSQDLASWVRDPASTSVDAEPTGDTAVKPNS